MYPNIGNFELVTKYVAKAKFPLCTNTSQQGMLAHKANKQKNQKGTKATVDLQGLLPGVAKGQLTQVSPVKCTCIRPGKITTIAAFGDSTPIWNEPRTEDDGGNEINPINRGTQFYNRARTWWKPSCKTTTERSLTHTWTEPEIFHEWCNDYLLQEM